MGYLRCFMKKLLLAILMLSVLNAFAQKDSVTVSLYVEPYYSGHSQIYSDGKNHDCVVPIYSYSRKSEFNLNLGLIRLKYKNSDVRANISLGVGTYMQANYSNEPIGAQNIFEANVGAKISKKHNLWVDAGVLPSHIGFESAVGTDNFTLSRSVVADNSPYYETGARLSLTSKNNKWFFAGFVLNGWQNIYKVDQDLKPSVGHQITFTPNEKTTINWSSFVGNVPVGNIFRLRTYSNLYAIVKLSSKWDVIGGFDVGFQRQNKIVYNPWYAGVIMARRTLNDKWKACLRSEVFIDEEQIIVQSRVDRRVHIIATSLNFDRKFSERMVWRTELRVFLADEKFFDAPRDGYYVHRMLTTSWAFTF